MKACLVKDKFYLDGPNSSSKAGRGIIEIFDKTIDQKRRLYYYAENNIPKLTLFDVGHASRVASRRRRRILNTGSIYYRDKSGALRMKAEFRKFGWSS